MSDIRLNSENFRAEVGWLGDHITNFSTAVSQLSVEIDRFEYIVGYLCEIAGLVAENESRCNAGHAPAYDEESFENVRKKWDFPNGIRETETKDATKSS